MLVPERDGPKHCCPKSLPCSGVEPGLGDRAGKHPCVHRFHRPPTWQRTLELNGVYFVRRAILRND